MAGKGWDRLDIVINCWEWLGIAGMADNLQNGWKWLEWQEKAGNGWKWLEITGMPGNGWKSVEIAKHG